MNMEDTRFIKSIRLRNLLSFGPESEPIELRPLNVLIGPNASGKSNFIDAISILQALPRDIAIPFREGGGVNEWTWKGEGDNFNPTINSVLINRLDSNKELRYSIVLGSEFDRVIIEEETISPNISENANDFIVKFSDGILQEKGILGPLGKRYNKSQSVFHQFRSPEKRELFELSIFLELIKIYRIHSGGSNSVLKSPQKSDLPSDILLESLNNFALVLHELKDSRDTGEKINKTMRVFYERFESIKTQVFGGIIQVLFYEKGLKDPIPSSRLSDGTLRFLCLLLILCHPSPPPLICIEEPEIGLHPDILHTVAELLIEASKRTQLIVTTRSDILVSALSEQPESILVCEHDYSGSHMTRLDQKKLIKWLENYSLGELWRMGEIGGNRW
jgi:predicted ATPase